MTILILNYVSMFFKLLSYFLIIAVSIKALKALNIYIDKNSNK